MLSLLFLQIGANQFHLPEGKPDAQVLDGIVTLVYPDLAILKERYESVAESLSGSFLEMEMANDEEMMVVDPWGSKFRLVAGNKTARDSRGSQPGDTSEGLGMLDLTIHTPADANLPGIGRFYEQVLGSVVAKCEEGECVQIQVGPQQTLTFQTSPSTTIESHVDLREEDVDGIPE